MKGALIFSIKSLLFRILVGSDIFVLGRISNPRVYNLFNITVSAFHTPTIVSYFLHFRDWWKMIFKFDHLHIHRFHPRSYRKFKLVSLLMHAGVRFYCQHCGREGHRKFYCPELKDSSRDLRFRCRLCGEKGHNKRTCPKSLWSNHNGRITRNNRCRICRERGHNSRTCPQATGSEPPDRKMRLLDSRNRAYTCQLCRQKRHNIRTCPSKDRDGKDLSPGPRDSSLSLFVVNSADSTRTGN